MKSQRKVIAIKIFVITLVVISGFGFFTYLNLLNNPVEEYDYIIFQEGAFTKAKNGKSGMVDFSSINASAVMNHVASQGNSFFIKFGEYTLNSDVILKNKRNARIIGDGTQIKCDGHRIVIKGDNYSRSQYNILSSVEIINGTVRIENSFKTTITNIIFRNCTTAIELVNTETWSEGTKIENSHFVNCWQSIVFRKPTGLSTGSYANTEISRCYFNLHRNDSVGIIVERDAEFTDSLIQNVRIWIGESDEKNQTGISVEGSMLQTLMQNVVFESFAEKSLYLYGMKMGQKAEPPILGGGVNFLGNWTARIYNPFGKWIFGLGGAFKREQVAIAVGLNNEYAAAQIIHAYPLEITSFKARIQVKGLFRSHETLTVRFRLEFIDNAVSKAVEKSFNQTATLWLEENDLFELTPAENVIWAVLVDAKTDAQSTSVTVHVDVYGTTA